MVDVVAEPGECKAHMGEGKFAEEGGGEDGAADEDAGGVTMDTVTADVGRMGALGQGIDGVSGRGGLVGKLHLRLDTIRDSMVTRDDYDRLSIRIRLGNYMWESEFQRKWAVKNEQLKKTVCFDEHIGYTDDGDEECYGFYEGDGNCKESDDDQAECED